MQRNSSRNSLGKWATAIALVGATTLPAIGHARDTKHLLPFEPVVQEALNASRLDGSVKFYLGDAKPAGKVNIVRSAVTTSKKTNAFNKSDEGACAWALQSALIGLQESAKNAGANAVVNIVSNYKHNVYKDNTNYECHAGAVMAGVALKADFATIK